MSVDLVQVIGAASRVRSFIEQDLIQLLVRLDLQAAAAGLKNLSHAKDKRGPSWSAINHIEAAEAKLRTRLRSHDAYHSAETYLYISAIKALLYDYLGERQLMARCLEESADVVHRHNRFARSGWALASFFASAFNPAAWASIARNRISPFEQEIADFNYISFWLAAGYELPSDFNLHTQPDMYPGL